MTTQPGDDAVLDQPVEQPVVMPDSTLPEDPTFQVIKGDVANGTVGKVNAYGTIYDFTYEGDEVALEIVNKGADEKGTTPLATLTVVETLDGFVPKIELTSKVEDRIVRKGDILAVKGGKGGTVKVTIQRL